MAASFRSPQMRNSTLKPVQMRNTPSPTPGSIRDGVCPRPAPVGISASPTTSRVRTTAPGRPLPVGNQSHLFANQKRSTVPITFSAASLRPNPVGDSGSPRLPRTGQVAFPRPAPIGHSASPMLPRVRNSPPKRTESPQNDDISGPPLTNTTPYRQGRTKQSTMRQEVTGNTSLQRQKPVTKNTLRTGPVVRKNSSGSPPGMNDILHRPTPVGNAGSSNTPSISAPSQKSFLLRYATPSRPAIQKASPAAHSGPHKPVIHTQLHVAEPESMKTVGTLTNHMSKRPTPMGISPSSTLKKSFAKKPVPNTPSPKTAVSSLPKLKPKESKVEDLNVSHQGSYVTLAVPKAKPDGLVPRTKCIVSLATQKVKAARNDSSLKPIEAEHCSVERTKAKGNKFSLKQKPGEKYGLSIQKSAGSVTFQRPKQTGNSGSQPPKCRNVVSSTKNSQPSSALPRPQGNAEVTKPSSSSGISLSKVIKNIPSARPKQKDVTVTNMTRPQPVGNISTSVSKSKSPVSLNYGKLYEGIVRTPPKKIGGNLLPRLPFMQKKSPPKMSLLKTSPSRAGENNYLVCSPGRKTAPNVPEEEESDMIPLPSVSSSYDESLDLHKNYRDSWEVDLTEESLEAALRASASTFNPIQDEHLVLVRPRLLGSHLSDAFLEQKYRISKTNDG